MNESNHTDIDIPRLLRFLADEIEADRVYFNKCKVTDDGTYVHADGVMLGIGRESWITDIQFVSPKHPMEGFKND
jgi:hypothetical protein